MYASICLIVDDRGERYEYLPEAPAETEDPESIEISRIRNESPIATFFR